MVVAVLDPGDEVLIPSPYWVSYPEQARLVGGVPVEVETREATGFDLDPDRLGAGRGARPQGVNPQNPNNPTGARLPPRGAPPGPPLAGRTRRARGPRQGLGGRPVGGA